VSRIDEIDRGGAGQRGFADTAFTGKEDEFGQVSEHDLFRVVVMRLA
jgi:hypothetical protein